MSGSAALVGTPVVTVDGQILNDFADGDYCKLTFPNDKSVVKIGKNGNAIYAQNAMGALCEIELRLLRGSFDDKRLNSRIIEQGLDFAGFIFLPIVVVVPTGDGVGGSSLDTYNFAGGIFKRNVDAQLNAEGTTDQAVTVYTITAKLEPDRSIQ